MEQGFLPWLMDQVSSELDQAELGRLVLDGLLREVVANRTEIYDALEMAKATANGSAKPREVGSASAAPTDGPTATLNTDEQVSHLFRNMK